MELKQKSRSPRPEVLVPARLSFRRSLSTIRRSLTLVTISFLISLILHCYLAQLEHDPLTSTDARTFLSVSFSLGGNDWDCSVFYSTSMFFEL